MMTTWEQRQLRALLVALLPVPAGRAGLPSFAELDLPAFLTRFDEAAPAHLRAGLRAATLMLAVALPPALGHRGTALTLEPAVLDEVLERAASTPGLVQLVEILKLVAAFAWFEQPMVQESFRGGGPADPASGPAAEAGGV